MSISVSVRHTARGRAGFTLVELLVVIAIIALLLGIGVPAALQMKKQATFQASLSTINMLGAACGMYKNDFDYYPPSDRTEMGLGATWSGGQILCLLLTGYAPNQGTTGVPVDLTTDDGKDGPGFRIETRGRVYGPYNGAENVQTYRSDTILPFFADAFDNPILYYRYDVDNDLYYDTDANFTGEPSDFDPNNFNATYSKNSSNAYYRTDFAMCSTGANGVWSTRPGVDNSDDVTNFFE